MSTVVGRHCDGVQNPCPPLKECCKTGCCPSSSHTAVNFFNPLFLGHWYFWLAVTATVAGILCACSLWKRHSQGGMCCRNSTRNDRISEQESNGSIYAPPQYSRCNSFYQPPPPYSEVTSKPDLYPLVINCHSDSVSKNNSGSTGYLMVQYFRNFIVRPVGSLSATSTIDSLSSSFICNAANEANVAIPPPYSNVGSLEEVTTEPHNYPPEIRSMPRSFSLASCSETHRSTPSVHSHVSSVHAPSEASSSHRVSPHLQQPTVSITDNPCFEEPTKLIAPNIASYQGGNENVKVAKNQNNCDDISLPLYRVNKKLANKHKLPKERSQDSEDEHNFSDLLNLSLCAPSSTMPGVATQSNPLIHCSVTNSMTGSDISSLANLGSPDSPPRATSPTIEMKELLDKIQQLPQQKSPIPPQPEIRAIKAYLHKMKAKTMYMPLNEVNSKKTEPKLFTKSWMSRSAPNTPSGNVVPMFPVHKRQSSGSQKVKKFEGDSTALLYEHQESEDEAKTLTCS